MDGVLPDDIFQPIRDWLNETAQHADRRVAVLSQTMSGTLDTFKTRVPRLAAHVDAQVALRGRLSREAEVAYATALAEFDDAVADGRLLAGEVLARWQDYAASGDLSAALRGKRGAGLRRGGKRARTEATTSRYAALETALRDALRALVVSVADRAAERVARAWKENPGGAALLAGAEESQVRDARAIREFESVFGPSGTESGSAGAAAAARAGIFDRSSAELPSRVSRAVSAWQDQLMRLMQSEYVAQGPGGKAVLDIAPLSVVALVALLAEPSQGGGQPAIIRPPGANTTEGEVKDGIGAMPREVLASVIGEPESAALVARARQDLRQRVGLLLDEELLRFGVIIDRAGPIDAVAAVRPVPGRVLARGGPMSERASESVSTVRPRMRPTNASEEGT